MTNYKFGTNQALENLWLRFSTHPKGSWIMKIEMVTKLVELIEKYKPVQILELGTGIGTATACIASILDNARITTVEQDIKVMETAKELIPHDFKNKITFEHRPATVMKPINDIDPFRFWSVFIELPWAKWDLIIIDGPGPFMLKDTLVDLPNGDIIWMLPKIAPGTKILIQGRREARNLYKRYLAWYLDVVEEDGYVDDYCLFERTNLSLNDDLSDFRNSDMIRGKLMESRYFE